MLTEQTRQEMEYERSPLAVAVCSCIQVRTRGQASSLGSLCPQSPSECVNFLILSRSRVTHFLRTRVNIVQWWVVRARLVRKHFAARRCDANTRTLEPSNYYDNLPPTISKIGISPCYPHSFEKRGCICLEGSSWLPWIDSHPDWLIRALSHRKLGQMYYCALWTVVYFEFVACQFWSVY